MISDLTGRTLLARYRIDAPIGEGGMARVYRATDLTRGATVAVKVLREDLAEDREFVRRFRKEAQTLAQLNHPNIVRFIEFGNEGRLAFIVMDYIAGTTLRGRLLDVNAPLPPAELCSIVRQIGAALAHAHAQGIIHRDVKPGNIMLTSDGRALLSDFGIAKMADSATITTVAPGTPAYSSPEQVLSRPLDYRTDIYSFGIVLYEMATGQRPFNGDTAPETLASTTERIRWEQVKGAPADPCRLNPGLPLEVARVIGRAMLKEPRARWQVVSEMAAAFERASARMVNDIPSSPTLASWKQAGVQVVDRFEWKPPVQEPRKEPVAPVQPAARPTTRGMTMAQWGALTVLAAAVIVVMAQAFSIWSDVRMQAAEATAIAKINATMTAQTVATMNAQTRATSTARAQAEATATVQSINTLAQKTKRVFGPVSGTLENPESGYIMVRRLDEDLRNFVAEVHFFNPNYSSSWANNSPDWDYGFGFRDTGRNEQYRLFLRSGGTWNFKLAIYPNQSLTFKNISDGRIENLDLHANGSNRLRLVVKDKSAFFFVNDVFISMLDASDKIAYGDVWIGTSSRGAYGTSIRYEAFVVGSLD